MRSKFKLLGMLSLCAFQAFASSVAMAGQKIYFATYDGERFSCDSDNLECHMDPNGKLANMIYLGAEPAVMDGASPETAYQLDVNGRIFREYILDLIRFGKVVFRDQADTENTLTLCEHLGLPQAEEYICRKLKRPFPRRQGLKQQQQELQSKEDVLEDIRQRQNWDSAQSFDDLFTFVAIPAGHFNMGNSAQGGHAEYYQERDGDEIYIENVEISAFEMQATLLTQLQYFSITGQNPSCFKQPDHCPGQYRDGMCPHNPVESVSYNAAQGMIAQLNARSEHYSYRLPTAAEWEYAAKAGGSGPFPWGDGEAGLGRVAWYSANSGDKTHPVASKEANAWNLFDMIGNTWEWVGDSYMRNRSGLGRDNPFHAGAAGDSREIRGGSGWDGPQFLRPAWRYNGRPTGAYYDLGLRLVRTAK